MGKYDYKKAIIQDIKEYIQDNPEKNINPLEIDTSDEIFNYWYDELWAEDSVTGNGSYYYASEEECEKYLTNNLKLAFEAIEFFEVSKATLIDMAKNDKIARYLDCIIRCYLLGECVDKALKELNSNF